MLIDDVLNRPDIFGKFPPGQSLDDPFEPLRNALVVRGQNVWDYYRLNFLGKENPNEAFPNVAPPAPVVWLEWVADDTGVLDPLTGAARVSRVKIGILCFAADTSLLDESGRADVLVQMRERGMALHDDTRWLGFGFVFSRILEPGRFPHLLGRIDWQVGQTGQLFSTATNGGFHYSFQYPDAANAKNELDTMMICTAQVSWLAFSLMHCKNVRLEKGPPIPDRLRKARERKGKPPLFRHHTILIDPMRPQHANQDFPSAGSGESMGLHICRGHFKDFTRHGLFGRHKGIYWWPMYLRGSLAHGAISKDYEVQP